VSFAVGPSIVPATCSAFFVSRAVNITAALRAASARPSRR
jgi:hypothetical protein